MISWYYCFDQLERPTA